jgi:hypothetical protein
MDATKVLAFYAAIAALVVVLRLFGKSVSRVAFSWPVIRRPIIVTLDRNYSALMPASLTTLPQVSYSRLM